jgi:hypothetical protein
MTTIKAIFGILIITSALAVQAYAQVPTNGLVAYYPFNGNANDETGNGNDLTNYGATLCPDRFGNPNNAYFFDGTNEFVGTSTPPLTAIDNWTITAWIRPATLPQTTAYAVCVGYDNGTAGDGYAMGISGNGGGGTGFNPGNQLWAFFPGLGFIPDGFLFSSNEWCQVVMVRSSGAITFYVNGESITNGGPTTYTPSTPTAFAIGSGGGGGRFFAGAINDVRLYKVPLSESEIQQLYNYEATACTNSEATATATVSDGFVISATVTYGGCGYTNTPLVQILGGGGTGAIATALVTNGFVNGLMITDAGNGYTSTPSIFISPPAGCIPHSATANLTESNGFVIAATVTDPGCGYTNTPLVEILGGGGTGATATALVINGYVNGLMITDAGNGYTSAPSIFISPPGGCIPHSATATLTESNGFVIAATVTDPGCGYTNTPSIQILGGGGTGAVATAVVTNGEVVQIIITDAGIGYTSTPSAFVNSPIGAQIDLVPALVPRFSNLSVGLSYQLQSSTDLITWTTQGPAFVATNTTMYSSQYFNVPNTNQLYFRLQGAP